MIMLEQFLRKNASSMHAALVLHHFKRKRMDSGI